MTIRRLLMTAALFSLTAGFSAQAGQWIQQPNYSYEYHELWTYQKDDGRIAADEWLQIDGTWYYFQADGFLPESPGYASDNFCYNARGNILI